MTGATRYQLGRAKISFVAVSHIPRIARQPEKDTLRGGGQSRSWCAEKGKYKIQQKEKVWQRTLPLTVLVHQREQKDNINTRYKTQCAYIKENKKNRWPD